MLIYAHRGYSSIYPENTMSAFKAALDSGADGIETDIHLSSDGIIVITHDESIALQADRILSIEDGKITRDEVIRR